jgi:rubrerythrin
MAAGDLRKLIRQLQGAYSGELAAGYAYRGHWKSLREGADRERIRVIESEEWHHRELVGAMLAQLGARPNRIREAIFWTIGRVLGIACHVSGWYLPMYGAGWLERKNIVEYEDAAGYAAACGHDEMIDCLLEMAEVEWEHEKFFREKASSKGLLALWPAAPAKETIRAKR